MKMFDTMRRTNNNFSSHSFVNKKKSQSLRKEEEAPVETKAKSIPAKNGQVEEAVKILPISLTLRSIFQEGFPLHASTTQNLSLMEGESTRELAPNEKGDNTKFPTIVHGEPAMGVEIKEKVK